MLDLIGVLDPRNGLARASAVRAPDDLPLWLVAVDVGLSDAREAAGGERTPFDAVGAYGWSRVDAMTRAVGEAVERFSLVAPAGDPLVDAALPADADLLARLVAAGCLGRGAQHQDLAWARAVELTGAGPRPVALPAVLLTDPVPACTWADGSPSGAAAGIGWEFAAERALRESVERDASSCCWSLRPRLPFVDAVSLALRLGSIETAAARDVLEYLDRHDAVAYTVLLPTDLPGTTSAMTFVLGHEGATPVLATGARAATDPSESVAVSLREALQVYSSLLPLLERPAPPVGPVVDEQSRAWACMQAPAVGHFLGWVEKGGVVAAADLEVPATAAPWTAGGLAGALRDRGLAPLVADLSARLPGPVREQGWAAVRALVLGHQQYRMDDTKPWSVHQPRLEQWRAMLVDVDDVPPATLSHTLI
ncbi:MAG: YcaO-like family protein [Promicromonosporaceae bacterium]|nr:YcaO-like family protein [Promicromonosporaceae bacterium]